MKTHTLLRYFTVAALSLTMLAGTIMVNADTNDDKNKDTEEYVTNPESVELEKVGEIKDPKNELYFSQDVMFTVKDADKELYSFKDPLGNDIMKDEFTYLSALDDDDDIRKYQLTDRYYIGYTEGDQAQYKTLLDESMSNVLLDGDIGIIERLNDRFLMIVYIDEVTDDEEEAIMYFTADQFVVKLQPDDDDILWTGYMTVYDLQENKLLDSIKVTSPYGDIEAVGDSIYVEDENGDRQIYNASGKVIEKDASSYSYAGDYFYKRTDDGDYAVYDCNLKELFKSEYGSFSAVDYHPDLLKFTDSEERGIMDNTGKVLYSTKENAVFSGVQEDLIYIMTDDKFGFIDNEGNEVFEPTFDSTYGINGCGYYGVKNGDNYALINADGDIVEDIDSLNSSQCLPKNDEKGYYVFKTGDFIACDYSGVETAPYLISFKDYENMTYNLMEVINGTELLKSEYDSVEYAYGYVYAKKDGVYEVYKPVYK